MAAPEISVTFSDTARAHLRAAGINYDPDSYYSASDLQNMIDEAAEVPTINDMDYVPACQNTDDLADFYTAVEAHDAMVDDQGDDDLWPAYIAWADWTVDTPTYAAFYQGYDGVYDSLAEFAFEEARAMDGITEDSFVFNHVDWQAMGESLTVCDRTAIDMADGRVLIVR